MAHLTDQPYMGANEIMVYLDTFANCLYRDCAGNPPYIPILVMGGSALCLKYNYRLTVDIDADVKFSHNKRNAINEVAMTYNIPVDWLNEDVMKSNSYSRLLWDRSILCNVLHNFLEVRIVNDLDQLCMKVTAGRVKDMQDIVVLIQKLVQAGYIFEQYQGRYLELYGGMIAKKVPDRVINNYFIKSRRQLR